MSAAATVIEPAMTTSTMPSGQVQDAERRERERHAVRHGEGGHDLARRCQAPVVKASSGCQPSSVTAQHRRQQERDQEEDVIEAQQMCSAPRRTTARKPRQRPRGGEVELLAAGLGLKTSETRFSLAKVPVAQLCSTSRKPRWLGSSSNSTE